jgi:hypothetical protein
MLVCAREIENTNESGGLLSEREGYYYMLREEAKDERGRNVERATKFLFGMD